MTAVRPAADAPPARHGPAPGARSPLLYASRSGRPLGFWISGQGPPDVVLLPGSGLRLPGEAAEGPSFLDRLGRLGRVITIARPVDGRPSEDPEEIASDVIAVMDAAASDHAVLLGESEGGPWAAYLAAARADRVAGLLLYGSVGPVAGPEPTASRVAVPALVVHRVGDPQVPVGTARLLAARIPDAEYVELAGSEHSADRDGQQIVDAMAAFVEDIAAAEAAGRSLAALVGLAGEDPDSVADVLVQLGGVRRRGPEDALLVSFDGPAAAIRALASRRARGLLSGVGVAVAIDEVTAGSHFVAGHGVDVARLVAQQAAPGEVLMPNVIKDLLAGSGLVVEPAGTLDLDHVGPHPVHRWVR